MTFPKLKSPKDLLSTYIIAPAYRMKEKGLDLGFKASGKFADFVFSKSKETALIMLVFNAIAIFSSHTAQIKGLAKSNRENKEFLIEQEKKERSIDLFLTVIPPFLLKNYISKRLETGVLTTPSARKKLLSGVAPSVGAMRDDIYNTSGVTIKETLTGMASRFVKSLAKNSDKLPKRFENQALKLKELDKFLESKIPDRAPIPTLETIANRFDDRVKEGIINPTNKTLESLRNGSANDELCGQNRGILILATVLYCMVASNIIMPYFKNKLTNKEYERNLKEKGETKESMIRKRRYEFTSVPVENKNNEIFNPFADSKSNQSVAKTSAPVSVDTNKSKTFSNFNLYSDIAYRNSGLKI